MNKDKILLILVVIIVLLFTTLAIVLTTHRTRKQPVPPQKTIIVSDTITQVLYDTVFINHYKTVKLPTDTLYIDSVRIDSILVEVPISTYKLDTVFKTDTTNLNIRIQNSGYSVTLDTLYYRLEYKPTPPKLPKKKHRFGFYVGPAVGISYDWTTGKTLPSIGIGVGIGWSFGKY